MRKGSPRFEVVRREDKQARITRFISEHLRNRDGASDQQTWLLVARSPLSPVARALAALHAAGQLRATVHCIFCATDAEMPTAGVYQQPAFADSVHLLRDRKLLDAHEALVLGPAVSWSGDCMRRDPGHRDSWECFAEACESTSRQHQRSFERLWKSSGPLSIGSRTPGVQDGIPSAPVAPPVAPGLLPSERP